jgi:lactoylglutathione lyase
MKFIPEHNNINVRDLEKSVAFYKEALGMTIVREKEAPDGSFKLVFLQGADAPHQIELTWLRDHTEPYNLGENEFHLAFVTDDYDAAHAFHEKMGCIVYENVAMKLYFIADPDGYWIEILRIGH